MTEMYGFKVSYVLVDLTRFLVEASHNLPCLMSISHCLGLKETIAMLVSVSHRPQIDAPDDTMDLIFATIEGRQSPAFMDCLDLATLEREVRLLSSKVLQYLGARLPPGKDIRDYTVASWLEDTIVLMKND